MWFYKRKRRHLFFLFCVFFIIFLIIFLCLRARLIFLSLCKNEMQSVSLEIINDVVTKKLNVLNTDLLQFEKDEHGEITFVNSNVIYMNKLANEISIDISKKINSLDYLFVNLPIGTLIGSDMLNSLTPDIKINFIPVSDIKTEFKTDFVSTGINQTKHKVLLLITCQIEALSVLADTMVTTNLEIPIVETVIVGGVPNTYYHLERIERKDSLNLLE